MILFLFAYNSSELAATAINTTDLVIHLDASNPQSYSGTGTTWTNLVGSQSGFTIVNGAYEDEKGGIIQFNRSSGTFVVLGSILPANSNFTKEAWIYNTATLDSQNIISSNDSPFWLTSTKLSAGFTGNFSVAQDPNTFDQSTWTHVAVTFDDANNTIRLYKNGVEVDFATNVTQSYLGRVERIGAHGNATHSNDADAFSFFDGKISQVRVYSRALTSSEITSNFNATKYRFIPISNPISFARPLLTTNEQIEGLRLSGVNVTPSASSSGIVLTTSTGQASSVFLDRQISFAGQLNPGFSTFFTLNMFKTGSANIADGVVFIIAKNTNTIGASGGGLGYQGINNSIALEIDTYNNAENSPGLIHIDTHKDGVFITNGDNTIIDESTSYSSYALNQQFRQYNIWLDYDDTSGEMDFYIQSGVTNASLSRPATPFQTFTIDFSSVGETFYAGFTAATGGSAARYTISRWYLNNSYLASSIDPTSQYSEVPDLSTPSLSYSRNAQQDLVVTPYSADRGTSYFNGFQYRLNNDLTWQSLIGSLTITDSGVQTVTVRGLSTTGTTSAAVTSSGINHVSLFQDGVFTRSIALSPSDTSFTIPTPTYSNDVFVGWFEEATFENNSGVVSYGADSNRYTYSASTLVAPTSSFSRNDATYINSITLLSTDSGVNSALGGLQYQENGGSWQTYSGPFSPSSGLTQLTLRPLYIGGTAGTLTRTIDFASVEYYSGVTLIHKEPIPENFGMYYLSQKVPSIDQNIVIRWYDDNTLANQVSGVSVAQSGIQVYGLMTRGLYENTSGLISEIQSFAFSAGVVQSAGILEITSPHLNAGDLITVKSNANPNANGAISISNGIIYLGNGTSKAKIASVDSIDNGQNGAALKFNIDALLFNGDFSQGADGLDGWIVSNSRFDVPEKNPDGSNVNYSRFTFNNTATDKPSYTADNHLPTSQSYSVIVDANGRVKLTVSGNIGHASNGSYGSLHGPTIKSEQPFSAASGDTISFYYSATGGSDDADVYAFVIDESQAGKYIPIFYKRVRRGVTDDGTHTHVFNSTELPNPSNQLKFLFVGGSFDASGGFALGSSFSIDNIGVESGQAISEATINSLISSLVFESGDNPSEQYEFTISGSANGSVLESGVVTIDVKPLNDPISHDGTSGITVNQNQSLSINIGSHFSDPDSNMTFTTSGLDPIFTLQSSGIFVKADGTAISNGDVGTYTFSVIANEGFFEETVNYQLQINNVNDAPQVNNAVELPTRQFATTVSSGQIVIPSNAFTDIDSIHGDTLTYSIAGLDAIACDSFDPATRTIQLTNCNLPNAVNYTVTVTATDSSGATASRTFVLQFTALIRSTVSFETGSGSTVNDVDYFENDTIVRPSDPTRLHYQFAGWYSDSGLTTLFDFSDVMPPNNITIYAKWTPSPFAITYNLNNGSNGANPATFTIEDEVILSSGSRTGYTFAGWFSDAALSTPITKIPLGTSTTQTVYAKWTVINYPIQYVYNIGNTALKGSYTIEDETYVFPPAGSAGREFMGWFYDSAFTQEATQITAGSTGGVTVYAKWQAYEYTLSFRADGRTVESVSVVFGEPVPGLNPAIPEKKGHTAVGWDGVPPATMPARSVRINAIYQINQYTATYEDDEGNVLGSETLDYGSALSLPTPPEKEGYTFKGWSSAASTMPDADITIKAEYEALSFTVTFIDDQGTTLGSAEVEFESAVTPITPPEREGFTFKEWQNLPSTMPAEAVTVTAVYEEVVEEEEETPEEPDVDEPTTEVTQPTIPGGGTITVRPVIPNQPTETPNEEETEETPVIIDPTPVTTRIKVEGTVLDVSIIPGEPIGRLPEAELDGYNFTGWMNAVTGEMLTEESVINDPETLVLLPVFEKAPNLLDAARRVFSTPVVSSILTPRVTNDNTTRTDNITATNEYGADIIDTLPVGENAEIAVRSDGTALITLATEKTPITIDATQFDLTTVSVQVYVGDNIPEQDNDNWAPYDGKPFLSSVASQSVYIKVQDDQGNHQVTYLKEATYLSNPEMIPVRDIIETNNNVTTIEQLVLTPKSTFVTKVEYEGEVIDLFVIDPDENEDLIDVVVRYRANEHNNSILLGVNAAVWQTRILSPVEAMGVYIREGDNVDFTLEYRYQDQTSVIEEFNVVKANQIVDIVVTPPANPYLLAVLAGLVSSTAVVQWWYHKRNKKKEA